MGWNTLDARRSHPLFADLALGKDGLHAYFVHSYHLAAADSSDLVAESDYGGPVTAVVARDNYRRNPIPPGKEPETRACFDREFPQVETVNRPLSVATGVLRA